MGHVDSMPKELGSHQSRGPNTVWKGQNQINGVYKNSQGNKLILKGILCSCQNPWTQKRKDRWSLLLHDSWVIISVLCADKNDTIFQSTHRRARTPSIHQRKGWPFTKKKKSWNSNCELSLQKYICYIKSKYIYTHICFKNIKKINETVLQNITYICEFRNISKHLN